MRKNRRKTHKKQNTRCKRPKKRFARSCCTPEPDSFSEKSSGLRGRASPQPGLRARRVQICPDPLFQTIKQRRKSARRFCELKIKTRNGRSGPHLGELSRRGVVPGAVGTGQHSSLRGKNQREGPTGRKEVTGSSIPRLLTVRVYSLIHPRSHRFNQQSGRPVSTESPAGESVDPQSHR